MSNEEALKYLDSIKRTYLTPTEASKLLGCSPYTLNIQAKEGRLAIEHMMVGTRLKISKAALERWCGRC